MAPGSGATCANARFATVTCSAPRVDAEVIDRALVAHVDTSFLDFKGWTHQVAERQGLDRAGSVCGTRKRLASIDRLRVKARADYLRQLDVGRSDAAEVAADALTDLAAQREDAEAGMRAAEEALKAAHGATSADALFDFFNDLAARVRGSGGSEALGEVNARLRDGFEAVVLEAFEDGDILAQPVLHPSLVAERRGR